MSKMLSLLCFIILDIGTTSFVLYLQSLKYSFQMDNRFCIVMEYVNGGNLFFHLSTDKWFAEEKVCFYGAEITLAIQHLHNLGVVYSKLTVHG